MKWPCLDGPDEYDEHTMSPVMLFVNKDSRSGRSRLGRAQMQHGRPLYRRCMSISFFAPQRSNKRAYTPLSTPASDAETGDRGFLLTAHFDHGARTRTSVGDPSLNFESRRNAAPGHVPSGVVIPRRLHLKFHKVTAIYDASNTANAYSTSMGDLAASCRPSRTRADRACPGAGMS
jgi:hypothetical protein